MNEGKVFVRIITKQGKKGRMRAWQRLELGGENSDCFEDVLVQVSESQSLGKRGEVVTQKEWSWILDLP